MTDSTTRGSAALSRGQPAETRPAPATRLRLLASSVMSKPTVAAVSVGPSVQAPPSCVPRLGMAPPALSVAQRRLRWLITVPVQAEIFSTNYVSPSTNLAPETPVRRRPYKHHAVPGLFRCFLHACGVHGPPGDCAEAVADDGRELAGEGQKARSLWVSDSVSLRPSPRFRCRGLARRRRAAGWPPFFSAFAHR